jgi:hypothetical protein
LQLEGRRTVTLGPRVSSRTPLDLPDPLPATARTGWRTIDLTPGTLFHMPPRTPHRVVCHGRSLAVSLTWTCARPRGSGFAARTAWDVVEGSVDVIPRQARYRLWVQVPVIVGDVDRRRGTFPVSTADGDVVRLPASLHAWGMALEAMPWFHRGSVPVTAFEPLVRSGLLAPVDLPRMVRPKRPRALDGWRFA